MFLIAMGSGQLGDIQKAEARAKGGNLVGASQKPEAP
jgi:hypothetical protein